MTVVTKCMAIQYVHLSSPQGGRLPAGHSSLAMKRQGNMSALHINV